MGRWFAVLLLLVVGATGVQAAARSPASLVPANAMFYGELDLAQFGAVSREAKPLDQAFEQSGLLPAVRALAADTPEAAEAINKFVAMISEGLRFVGPRVGWSVLPGLPPFATPGMPAAFLVVADIRDAAAFSELMDRALLDYRVEYEEEERPDGVRVISTGDLVVAMGPDWAALCTSPGTVDVVAKLTKSEGAGSLAAEPRYQRAIKGLPQEAVVTEYLSPALFASLSAFIASESKAAPGVRLPALPEDGLAWALQASVESREGRRLLSLTWVADAEGIASVTSAAVVALVTPVFERARESERKTQCLSNVKSITLAMEMYLTDYDKFPKADRWTTDLDEYIRNPDVLRCPSDPSGAACSYGMNWGFSGKPSASVKDASRQVVIYETAHPGPCPRGGKTDVASPPRHMGGNNFGFVDGHAKWVSEGAAKAGAVDW